MNVLWHSLKGNPKINSLDRIHLWPMPIGLWIVSFSIFRRNSQMYIYLRCHNRNRKVSYSTFFLDFPLIRCVGVYLMLMCGSFWHIFIKWLRSVRGTRTLEASNNKSVSQWVVFQCGDFLLYWFLYRHSSRGIAWQINGTINNSFWHRAETVWVCLCD